MTEIAGSIPFRDTFFKIIGPTDQSDFFAHLESVPLISPAYGPHHRIHNMEIVEM